jgi:hypothetical protein
MQIRNFILTHSASSYDMASLNVFNEMTPRVASHTTRRLPTFRNWLRMVRDLTVAAYIRRFCRMHIQGRQSDWEIWRFFYRIVFSILLIYWLFPRGNKVISSVQQTSLDATRPFCRLRILTKTTNCLVSLSQFNRFILLLHETGLRVSQLRDL